MLPDHHRDSQLSISQIVQQQEMRLLPLIFNDAKKSDVPMLNHLYHIDSATYATEINTAYLPIRLIYKVY